MSGNRFAIAVLSRDRIGIIGNVTGAVLKLGGNIDEMSQTVMSGCFTILITAEFPDDLDGEAIRSEIAREGRRLDLDVMVQRYEKPEAKRRERPNTYFLTAKGKDRKGIVHEIASCLAGHGVNIIDLFCSNQPPGEFLLISEIDIPAAMDMRQLQIDLEQIGDKDHLAVRIQHENLFKATNDLYLTTPEPVARAGVSGVGYVR